MEGWQRDGEAEGSWLQGPGDAGRGPSAGGGMARDWKLEAGHFRQKSGRLFLKHKAFPKACVSLHSFWWFLTETGCLLVFSSQDLWTAVRG